MLVSEKVNVIGIVTKQVNVQYNLVRGKMIWKWPLKHVLGEYIIDTFNYPFHQYDIMSLNKIDLLTQCFR